jgi:hypothetical protein
MEPNPQTGAVQLYPHNAAPASNSLSCTGKGRNEEDEEERRMVLGKE